MYLPHDCEPIHIRMAATLSSVASTDIINMENYDRVTFIVTMGTVTTGGNISVRQMDSVSDTVASESALGIDYYYEKTSYAGSGTNTKTSANTVSSVGGVTVGNSDDSHMFVFEVRASELASDNNCIALHFLPSTWNTATVGVMALCHRPRFHQAQPITALA